MTLPYRQVSETLAWLCLFAILGVGLPLFICMPLWVDTTYHDVSARNILWGGVHYRDVFETNLPGMVWLHALIRPLIGWSSEAIRTADFVVVGASILLLALWVKRIGIGRAGQVWFLATAFFFYLFESEFIHCQRDGWMLLPTVIGLHLRGRQMARAMAASPGRLFRAALLEGMVWACAIWIKPHAAVPAMFVWLSMIRPLAGLSSRKALFDFLGLLSGGLLIGGAGSAWLIATGAWPFMWDVLLNWNGEYYKWTPAEIDLRLSMVIMYFAPWSLVHFAALPLAAIALFRARIWRWGWLPELGPARRDHALLAALYVGWFTEAVFLQKIFPYSQAPVHLLAFAVLAAQRWPVGPVFIVWCVLGGVLNECRAAGSERLDRFHLDRPFTYQQVVPRHKLINQRWRDVWWTCVVKGSSPELKDRLTFYPRVHCAPNWTDLEQAKEYLQMLHLRDGELVCWDDTTHPLYLDLNLRPSFRFMHVNTSLEFRSKRPRLREELIATGHRYVVSDFAVVEFIYGCSDEAPDGRPLDLPEDFPCFCRDVYPWNQPVVAKFGRYWVHRIEKPIGAIRIPYSRALDKQ